MCAALATHLYATCNNVMRKVSCEMASLISHWARAADKVAALVRNFAGSTYITQVTAIGPLGIEYVNSKDDPRNGSSET